MPRKIYNEEEVVPECKGCDRITKGLGMGDKQFCACHPFPKIHWWGGYSCPDATHIDKNQDEDPTEEGRYDYKKR